MHTDGHRFPVIVVHIYTLAGQDGPRSLVIVKIVIPCCRPSPGDLLCKTNTSAHAKVPSSSSSLSSGQSRPLASTCLPKQTTRHFIRSIHLRLVSNLRLFLSLFGL